MIGLLTTILAALAAQHSTERGDRGRVQELEGRLGLRRERKRLSSFQHRLLWVLEVSKKDPEVAIRTLEFLVRRGALHHGNRLATLGYAETSLTRLINGIGIMDKKNALSGNTPKDVAARLNSAHEYFVDTVRNNAHYAFVPASVETVEIRPGESIERTVPAYGPDLDIRSNIEPLIPWVLGEMKRLIKLARDDKHQFHLTEGQLRNVLGNAGRWAGYGPGSSERNMQEKQRHGTGADVGYTHKTEYALTRQIRKWCDAMTSIKDWAMATNPDMSDLTWAQAKLRADQWHREIEEAAAKADKIKTQLAMAEQARICEWDDSWYLVQLKTPRDLDAETAWLGHCIGGGGYDQRVQSKDYAYYSLRNPDGEPEVTFETRVIDYDKNLGQILQAKGRNNMQPRGRLHWPAMRAAGHLLTWWTDIDGPDLDWQKLAWTDDFGPMIELHQFETSRFEPNSLQNFLDHNLHPPRLSAYNDFRFWVEGDENEAILSADFPAVVEDSTHRPAFITTMFTALRHAPLEDDEDNSGNIYEDILWSDSKASTIGRLVVPLRGLNKPELHQQVGQLYEAIKSPARPYLYIDESEHIRVCLPDGVTVQDLALQGMLNVLDRFPDAVISEDDSSVDFLAQLRAGLSRKER